MKFLHQKNGQPFFAGFEIPDGKKVFYLGKDVAGTKTLKLKFFNAEATDTVTIKGIIRQ